MEYSKFKEKTSQTADKELERCKYIEKEHNQEVNELKSEIKHLKSELSESRSQTSHNEYVPLITKNSSQRKTSAQQDIGASARKASAAANNRPRPTFWGANLDPRMSEMRWHRVTSIIIMPCKEL